MSAKSNLLIYLKLKDFKKRDFYKLTGLSNGFLDKGDNISSENIEIIGSSFPDLNLEWLITGTGDMIKKGVPATNKIVIGNKGPVVSDSQNVEINKNDSEDLRAELIESYKEQIRMLKEKIEEKSKELAEKCNDLERLKQEYDDLKNDKSF